MSPFRPAWAGVPICCCFPVTPSQQAPAHDAGFLFAKSSRCPEGRRAF